MASTFLVKQKDSGKSVCRRRKFHISRRLSMNGFATFVDESGRGAGHWRLPLEKDFAMNGTVGFLIAVGGVSAICYWLMSRVENRAVRRSSDGAGSDYSNDSSSIGGWNIANWFSSANSSSDSSGTSSASGSWDSGGGSDGGGGGGGGGGD
jgi:uncharacterized membrane protein YgcG